MRAQILPVGCVGRFDYHDYFFFIAFLPAAIMLLLAIHGVVEEGTIRTRIARGVLDEAGLRSDVNFLGIPTFIARNWPRWLPCDRFGDFMTASAKVLGLEQQGSNTAVVFVLFDCLAPAVVSSGIRMFVCEHYDDGTRFLQADLAIDCKSQKHFEATIFCVVMLTLITLVLPWLIYAALRKFCTQINPPSDHELNAQIMRANDSSLDALRVVFSAYRPSCWRYSLVEFFRRSLLMSCPIVIRWTFPGSTSFDRLLAGAVLSFIAFQINQQLSPFAATSLTILSNVGNLEVS